MARVPFLQQTLYHFPTVTGEAGLQEGKAEVSLLVLMPAQTLISFHMF